VRRGSSHQRNRSDAALSTVIAQLESATAAQIPPARAVDLIAIAEALNNTQ